MIGAVVRHKISNTRRALASLSEHCRRRVLSMCMKTMKIARESVEISPYPSRPGSPPHSRDGTLPKSVAFDIQVSGGNPSAVLGPIAFGSGAGASGDITRAIEHGGETVQQDGSTSTMAARPWVTPALEAMHRDVRRIWASESL